MGPTSALCGYWRASCFVVGGTESGDTLCFSRRSGQCLPGLWGKMQVMLTMSLPAACSIRSTINTRRTVYFGCLCSALCQHTQPPGYELLACERDFDFGSRCFFFFFRPNKFNDLKSVPLISTIKAGAAKATFPTMKAKKVRVDPNHQSNSGQISSFFFFVFVFFKSGVSDLG